jgi:hypothetical protein
MRIQYISDLHLEFGKPRIFGPNENTKEAKDTRNSDNTEDSRNCVLCLAGDIGYPFTPVYEKFLINVSRCWKKIFLICGHTHTGFEKRINDVIVYCNPGGYPGENEGLNMNKFIKID